MMNAILTLTTKSSSYLGLIIALVAMSACQPQETEVYSPEIAENTIVPVVEEVLSAEEQDKLTPDQIIRGFEAGNLRFLNNVLTARDHSKQVREAVFGQFPKAIVLSCTDSRIPVEDVLDKGLGDLLVARVAGNFVNEDILGSMEFACKVAGAKVVVVMGHEHCSAVLAAIDGVAMGNMKAMLANLQPAINASDTFEGEKTSSNSAFVKTVSHNNVRLTVEQVRQQSPLLKAMEQNGEIAIVGAYYDLVSGKLTLL